MLDKPVPLKFTLIPVKLGQFGFEAVLLNGVFMVYFWGIDVLKRLWMTE
jgi:hypothetical protein